MSYHPARRHAPNSPAGEAFVVDLDAETAPGDGGAARRRPIDDPRGGDRAGPSATGAVLPLYTPAQAAQLLAVRESWLRRRATARAVPCTFLGKHLRFSHADVVAIALAGAHPPGPRTRPRRSTRPARPDHH